MRTALDRHQLQRLVQRHRRAIAAGLAGLATLMALTVIRSPQDPANTIAPTNLSTRAGVGEVAVPILLKDPAIASIARIGDRVDVLAVAKVNGTQASSQAPPRIVARKARVVEGSAPDTGFMPLATGLLVVAVDESTALDLASAATTSELSIAVHPRS